MTLTLCKCEQSEVLDQSWAWSGFCNCIMLYCTAWCRGRKFIIVPGENQCSLLKLRERKSRAYWMLRINEIQGDILTATLMLPDMEKMLFSGFFSPHWTNFQTKLVWPSQQVMFLMMFLMFHCCHTLTEMAWLVIYVSFVIRGLAPKRYIFMNSTHSGHFNRNTCTTALSYSAVRQIIQIQVKGFK